MTPVEMLGYVEFPPITREPYRLIWDRMVSSGWNCTERPTAPEPSAGRMCRIQGLTGWLAGSDSAAGEYDVAGVSAPPKMVRWKRGIFAKFRSADWAELAGAAMVFLHVDYESGPCRAYFAPLKVQ